jgi:GR25 family glycosyltransferase involved in LPS biosynthesis
MHSDNLVVCYLNLTRRPDRNTHFQKECTKAGLKNVLRFDALDGRTYIPSDTELDRYFSKCYCMGKPYQNNVICNFLGHMRMWRHIVNNDLEYALICQDDVVFIDGVKNDIENILNCMPERAGIINIGFHEAACYALFKPFDLAGQNADAVFKRFYLERVNDFVGVLQSSINPNSLCYILTNEGARGLLEHTEKHGAEFNTDHHMNDYFNGRGTQYGSLRILATGDPSFGSDIFARIHY